MKSQESSLPNGPKTTTPAIKQRLLGKLREPLPVTVSHTVRPDGTPIVIYNIDVRNVPVKKLAELVTDWVTKIQKKEGIDLDQVRVQFTSEGIAVDQALVQFVP